MDTYEVIRNLHILSGTVALAAFWTAASLRKGSRFHRTAGRVFMIAMAAITVTGIPLAFAIFSKGRPITASVLLYIVVITVTPAWLAWRAVRIKDDFERYTGGVYKVLAGINIVSGAAMLALGLRIGNGLVGSISLIGIATGALMLYFARRVPATRNWWLVRHYASMIGAGIATHVTFLNIGFSRLLPSDLSDTTQQLSWLVPFVVAFGARAYLDRKYGL